MRVNQNTTNQASSTESKSTKKTERAPHHESAVRTSAAKRPDVSESVNTAISPRAKEFAKAKEVASHVPDVREEKVAALKKRISEGEYKVDPQAVADRMVNDHLTTALK